MIEFQCPLCNNTLILPPIKHGTYKQFGQIASHLSSNHSVNVCPCSPELPIQSHLGGLGFTEAGNHLRYHLLRRDDNEDMSAV